MTSEKILYGVRDTFESAAKKATPKYKTTPGRILFAGFMAGAFIAFGFILAIVASAGYNPKLFPDEGNISAFKLLLGAMFPVGLIAVVLAGADLWTGNVLFLSSAKAKRYAGFKDVLYNWIGSYGGNYIGSFFLALVAAVLVGIVAEDPFKTTVIGIATEKVSHSFLEIVFSAIGCNWLVNVAIWQSARVNDGAGKILSMWFPIFAFVAIGFEHSVANMWAIPTAIFLSDYTTLTWSIFFIKNLIPVTIGNAIGGFFFVTFYYWYLSHPEIGPSEMIKEIVDFIAVSVTFLVIMVGVPTVVAIVLDNTLGAGIKFITPLIISIYAIIAAFAMYGQVKAKVGASA